MTMTRRGLLARLAALAVVPVPMPPEKPGPRVIGVDWAAPDQQSLYQYVVIRDTRSGRRKMFRLCHFKNTTPSRHMTTQPEPNPIHAHYLNEGATLIIETSTHRVGIPITEKNEEGCAAVFRAINGQNLGATIHGPMRMMPKYKCHKEVFALKIRQVNMHAHPDPNFDDSKFLASEVFQGGHLFPEDPAYAPIPVDADWFRKHKPTAGGYYVVYEDGYTSFSPAAAFENGYTLIK
jgi:hypothetical protein